MSSCRLTVAILVRVRRNVIAKEKYPALLSLPRTVLPVLTHPALLVSSVELLAYSFSVLADF